MRDNKILFFFAIAAIILIIVNMFVTFIKITEFKKDISGNAFAYINFSVNSIVVLNLSINRLDWGEGAINSTIDNNATLYTAGNNSGVVLRGNWSGNNARGFVLHNIGTINCSVSIKTNKDAHDFFMGTNGTNEEYKLNVSNKEPNSCSGGSPLGVWYNVSKDSGGILYCNQFSHNTNSNEIYIDVLLTVPKDANKLGSQSDTITIIGSAAL